MLMPVAILVQFLLRFSLALYLEEACVDDYGMGEYRSHC